ncbi:MAG TPA: DUF3078 domain-containing protein [Candidatus Kapabacteria bacterium]|nr:DUF3078 domain-containing protein [Candidatus Kapabacteria bacterium]
MKIILKYILLILLTISSSYSLPLEKLDMTYATNDSNIKWDRTGLLGLNFSSVGLSNWAGGGNNSISVGANTGLGFNYIAKSISWNNSIEAGYGVIKLGNENFRKTDDRLIISSKFGHKAAENLSYSALLDFRTQFDRGYDYNKKDTLGNFLQISDFMSPGYLTLGLGMNYKPIDFIDIYFSPLSNRVIFVLNDSLSNVGAFGVSPGNHIKSELGSTFDMLIQKTLVQNVDLRSRLNLFAPYQSLSTIVVNWELGLNFKVNEYINAGFNLNLIYDDKILINRDDGSVGPATQIKHVILIGFAYKFNY